MSTAVSLAKRAWGQTSPNPMVGAILVKNGKIIGKGYHRRAGGPHAEINAINSSEVDIGNSTLYVTLEPCNHHGRTGPCTEAIVEAGIKRVVIGTRDPNPEVKGGGIEYLQSNGVEVFLLPSTQDLSQSPPRLRGGRKNLVPPVSGPFLTRRAKLSARILAGLSFCW